MTTTLMAVQAANLVKICKDCRFYGNNEFGRPDCLHPAAVNVDLVTGEQSRWGCQAMRLSPRCDTAGKLWEAKETP